MRKSALLPAVTALAVVATVMLVARSLSGPQAADIPAAPQLATGTPTASLAASGVPGAPGVPGIQGAAGTCRDDVACAAAQALSAADPACQQAITQLAVYGVRWKAQVPAQRFPQHARSDAAQGAITFSGNGAEFQDGSGTYRGVRYECDFDPGPRAVLDVRARPG